MHLDLEMRGSWRGCGWARASRSCCQPIPPQGAGVHGHKSQGRWLQGWESPLSAASALVKQEARSQVGGGGEGGVQGRGEPASNTARSPESCLELCGREPKARPVGTSLLFPCSDSAERGQEQKETWI